MDYTVGDTIYLMFTTRQFSDGVPTVLSGTPVVSAYENDSATQITAGITLGVSHDSVVGMNLLTIAATGGNGYESGKDYNLVITTGTVGGDSVVGEVVGTFSLGRSAAAVDLANGTDGLGAIKSDTAAVLVDTADMQPKLGSPAGASISADIADVPTVAEFNARTLVAASYFDPAADTVATVTTLTGHTAQTADHTANIAAILVDTGTTLQAELDAIQAAVITNAAGVDIAADIIAMKAETVLIVADTNELQTDWVNAGRLDVILDARAAQTTVDNIETDTQDIQARLPAALVGGLMSSDATAISTSATAADNLEQSALGIVSGAAVGTPTTTVIDTDLTEATTDHYKGRILTFVTGAVAGQSTDITGYNGATKELTVTALTNAPAATDTFVIT